MSAITTCGFTLLIVGIEVGFGAAATNANGLSVVIYDVVVDVATVDGATEHERTFLLATDDPSTDVDVRLILLLFTLMVLTVTKFLVGLKLLLHGQLCCGAAVVCSFG